MKTFHQTFLLLLIVNTTLLSCTKEVPSINTIIPKDQASYNSMLENLNSNIDKVLNESKPSYLSLKDYKINLLDGSMKISSSQQNKILKDSQQLIDYGTALAIKNNLKLDNVEDAIALGALYGPNDNLQTKYAKSTFQLDKGLPVNKSYSLGSNMAQVELTNSEAFACFLDAVGFDVAYAAGGLYTTWTATAIIKTFSTIAKRALGPIGVSIAAVSFSYCLYQEAND
jgi:hypothetical protein